MRLRQVLVLACVAAVPVIIGILVTAGGSGGPRTTAPGGTGAPAAGVPVTLHLGGAEAKVVRGACGTRHHFSVYRAGATIAVDVATSATGRWSARLKYKLCRGGQFVTAGEASLGHLAAPGLHARVRAPAPGLYAARVDLHAGGALAGRSRKRYFEIR